MIQGTRLTVYPVKDLARSKALYEKLLGVAPYADSPYYVGFKVGDQEIGLDPNGHAKGQTGPLQFLMVKDVKEALQAFVEAGAREQDAVKNVGGGKQIATIRDTDGNLIGLESS